MPGAKDARAVLFLDIDGLLEALPDEVHGDIRTQLTPPSAVGLSTRGEGSTAEFILRLTTR